jgi:hypothetical protein
MCASPTDWSRSGPSPARASAGPHPRRMPPWKRNSSPTKRNGRAPHARGSRPQRYRPRLPFRQRQGAGDHDHRALLPCDAHRLPGRGPIAAGKNAYDLLRATFPAGTVSGAPKIRAMQIIAQYEASQRGFYAGALGLFWLRRQHGHLHHAAHRPAEGRPGPYPGRRRLSWPIPCRQTSIRRPSTRPPPSSRPSPWPSSFSSLSRLRASPHIQPRVPSQYGTVEPIVAEPAPRAPPCHA